MAAIAKRFDTPRVGHYRSTKYGQPENHQYITLWKYTNSGCFNNQQTVEHLVGRVTEQLEIDSLTLLNEIKSERFSTALELNEELLSLFLPNSYEMYWNISATDFCDRMRVENDRFWNDSRSKA